MNYLFSHIARILAGEPQIPEDRPVDQLLLDSRKIMAPSTSLFFALKSPRRNGHQFIAAVYKKGVRNFVISEPVNYSVFPEANFLLVKDTLASLQELAIFHRKQFTYPVIGITGSNGKTIVKEWLYQLLHRNYKIVRSPRSYNSQIGVPLSVWQMNGENMLAIFEAGISQPGEMEEIEKIILPSIGVLTNIGEAHSENFAGKKEKLAEKMKLFIHADLIIAGGDVLFTNELLRMPGKKYFTWGKNDNCDVRITAIRKENFQTVISLTLPAGKNEPGPDILHFFIPFTDDASVENAITCCCVLLQLGFDKNSITERMKELHPVNMRLELKKGSHNCAVINDSYSADLSSLEIALNFLDQQNNRLKKTVILSDFLQSGLSDHELYSQILLNLKKHRVERLIGIGERITKGIESASGKKEDNIQVELYPSTDDFIKQFHSSHFNEESILVKGARVFAFERIVRLLEQKVHQTVLEINLNALVHNLKEFQQLLQPSTKIMAMVKAFAYGSGGSEIAGILQYHHVDYLGVAYADEGVELREAGITLPIMVMNPEPGAFESIVEHNLEPELYSFDLLKAFTSFLEGEGLQHYPVHIEIETGMNRLGFDANDIGRLADELLGTPLVKVQTVFSHLAASEEVKQDSFTNQQLSKFEEATQQLQEKLGYSFIRHIANSAAITRHPRLQLDMVRLGIGLYGVDSAGTFPGNLQTVATLKSTIAQIKNLKAGESVSYNRKEILQRDSVIATIRIGYADGLPRRLGNRVGKMYIHGQLAPVTGTVCMDMTMVDITDIPGVEEGDPVIIFGPGLPVQQVAQWADTIPYEIMAGVSQRVKRIYFEE